MLRLAINAMLRCLCLARNSETQLVLTIVHSIRTYNSYRSFDTILRFFKFGLELGLKLGYAKNLERDIDNVYTLKILEI